MINQRITFENPSLHDLLHFQSLIDKENNLLNISLAKITIQKTEPVTSNKIKIHEN